MNDTVKIPLKVDIKRMLDILAKQIYQSPLALLRENCQNAFDAILERQALGQEFMPGIKVTIERNRICVADNGIGMTRVQLDNNFWTAGSSGKNTPEARAAGVVGTFGIGAMANFGIAEALEVRTQSAKGGERLVSSVRRDQLSATENCIEIRGEAPSEPGTIVIAIIPESNSVDVPQAVNYVSEFVRFLDIPVLINEVNKSQQPFLSYLPKPTDGTSTAEANVALSAHLTADVDLAFNRSGEVWIHLTHLHYSGQLLRGEIILKQGMSQIRTFRSKFALSATGVSSAYNFGGIANLSSLEPTAGREALTTDSMQFLQAVFSNVDGYVSQKIAATDSADANVGFMTWVVNQGRYDLCSRVTISLIPGEEKIRLYELKDRSEQVVLNYYEGSDRAIRDCYATEEVPLIVPVSSNPKRQCQSNYIRNYCKTRHVSDAPQILSLKTADQITYEESALAFRLTSMLETDYFVKAEIRFGKMSHGLPFLVDTTDGLKITFDSESGSIKTMLELYNLEFQAFTGMVKDFLRSVIFPKIANLVPSSTRQGAEAFLNAIRRPREYVEYEMAEAEALKAILGDYMEGKLSFQEAAIQAAEKAKVNYQIVDAAATGSASSVIPDVVDNARRIADEADAEELPALPAITRMDVESNIKLLTIADGEPPLKSYRCFIAIADRIRREHADFFLQPHKTEIVWGGQKVLFIFQHHSGAFALYYEMQSNELLAETSGGGAYPTCTIAIKNQIYIPVIEDLRAKFIPTGSARKRFAVRSDLLFPESDT